MTNDYLYEKFLEWGGKERLVREGSSAFRSSVEHLCRHKKDGEVCADDLAVLNKFCSQLDKMREFIS